MTPAAESRVALLAFAEADPALAALLSESRERDASLAVPDSAHDTAHALRVALWTLRIGGDAVDPRHGIAAALLHDAVTLPKNHPDRARASELAAGNARARLAALGFAREAIDEIAGAVRDHSFSRGAEPVTALGKALQDADRLEALGALGIFRTASTGARMGARYFDDDDPWAERRALDDRRYSVDHFFAKLLKLPATMRTTRGREEAGRRVKILRAFLRSLGEEIGVEAPDPASPRVRPEED